MLQDLASSIMRTTIDIATPILDEVKRLQKREGGTLGELVTGLVADGLRMRGAGPVRQELGWISQPMRARVDLADKEAVFAILDDERS